MGLFQNGHYNLTKRLLDEGDPSLLTEVLVLDNVHLFTNVLMFGQLIES